MKRSLPGLSSVVFADGQIALPDGLFLVRIESAQYRARVTKPFIVLRFSVVEPKQHAGLPIIGRLYCTPKAIWKLAWFLKDFLYDPQLLAEDELDERSLRGLIGIVNASHSVVNGVSVVNLDGFAPACQWETLSQVGSIPSQISVPVQPRQLTRRTR